MPFGQSLAGVNQQGVNSVGGIYTLLRKWPVNQKGKSNTCNSSSFGHFTPWMLLPSNPNWIPPRFCLGPRRICLGALPSHQAPSVTASFNGNNPSDKEFCSINPRSCCQCCWWAKHLLWTLHVSSALGNASPWKSAKVLKAVKPGTYKGWNPVWNTPLNTFLFFSSTAAPLL